MKSHDAIRKNQSEPSAESIATGYGKGQSVAPPPFSLQATPIQRDENETIEMPPANITVYRGRDVEQSVSGLDNLRGQGVDADEMDLGRGEEDVNRNSPEPGTRLPFTQGGWNGEEILNTLGQHDRMSGTDSDSSRCVQAVAMASFIPGGPDAVRQYLGSISADSMISRPMNQRSNTARQVLEYVKQKLENQTATYGDLSWAQEAVHDLYNDDIGGRNVWIRRIDASQRPDPTLYEENRDTRSGHQLLIMKGNRPDSPVRLYEPEITSSGNHLSTVSGASDIANLFTEHPDLEIYKYVFVLGKIKPSAFASFGEGTEFSAD